jgi:hypothetical protein
MAASQSLMSSRRQVRASARAKGGTEERYPAQDRLN